MKISTKGRYGLKAVVDIAFYTQDTKCVSLKSVSERQGISENYLEQIIAPLKKARIVHSVRGAGGGYYLAKSPSELTAGDVLRILEGPLTPVDCLLENGATCGDGELNCATCSTKSVWTSLFKSINELVDSFTIADLMADYENMGAVLG
ncbi:MAG: Rrf2 family transcriptional regulator [Defluviitaleaceae bacterium]|nr:Rrf2 family transcriptional regulator [Defluviitaleaceae bacterium]